MRPESRKYLWDARHAAGLLASFAEGKALDDYLGDALLRSAVERQFQIIGEALAQLARRDPATERGIPDLRQIVAFRNILVHGYGDIDDRLVWAVLKTSLPAFHETIDDLLSETPEA